MCHDDSIRPKGTDNRYGERSGRGTSDSANFFRVRDTPFGSSVCGCANLIKSGIKIAVKVGGGDNYACLSLFSGKMSLFYTW